MQDIDDVFYFVSIVKRGYLLLPIFGFPTKNEKNTKKIHIKKIYLEGIKNK
jgi:hypothetical protein